jgi:predicted GNAT family N-acyltransferase
VEFRRITDDTGARHALGINTQVYGLQPEVSGSCLATRALFKDASRDFGYAEAVVRHALQQAAAATGVTRTSLDASDAGVPLYAQMGYTDTGETWGVWMLNH